jgi:hypothetical protein
MNPQTLIYGLNYANVAASGLLALSLGLRGLSRFYPFLAAYFVSDVLLNALFFGFAYGKFRGYLYFYIGGQTLELVLALLVALELYRQCLEGRPALARFSQRAAIYVLAAVAAVSLAGLYLGPEYSAARAEIQTIRLHQYLDFERAMVSALVLLLLILSAFLIWFPVRVRRNSALNIGVFVLYFTTRWAATLAASAWPGWTRAINVANQTLLLLYVLSWAWLLRRDGEKMELITGHRWNPAEIQRLTDQLDTINRRLMGM